MRVQCFCLQCLLILILCIFSCGALSRASPQAVSPQKAVKNLLAICTHLQNPELYAAEWANACFVNKKGILVLSRKIESGEICSFFQFMQLDSKNLELQMTS